VAKVETPRPATPQKEKTPPVKEATPPPSDKLATKKSPAPPPPSALVTVGEPAKRLEPTLVTDKLAEAEVKVRPAEGRREEKEEDKLSDEGLGGSSDEVSESSQVGLCLSVFILLFII
jgi:hypothetical protein